VFDGQRGDERCCITVARIGFGGDGRDDIGVLGQCDAAAHLGRDMLDALHDDVIGINHKYVATLVHEFDDEAHRGVAYGDAGIVWWRVFVGVAWFCRFDYTDDNDAFEGGLFDSADTTAFEVFAHQ
jgi:hypothetical protein